MALKRSIQSKAFAFLIVTTFICTLISVKAVSFAREAPRNVDNKKSAAAFDLTNTMKPFPAIFKIEGYEATGKAHLTIHVNQTALLKAPSGMILVTDSIKGETIVSTKAPESDLIRLNLEPGSYEVTYQNRKKTGVISKYATTTFIVLPSKKAESELKNETLVTHKL